MFVKLQKYLLALLSIEYWIRVVKVSNSFQEKNLIDKFHAINVAQQENLCHCGKLVEKNVKTLNRNRIYSPFSRPNWLFDAMIWVI
jgi:hypothetical protein